MDFSLWIAWTCFATAANLAQKNCLKVFFKRRTINVVAQVGLLENRDELARWYNLLDVIENSDQSLKTVNLTRVCAGSTGW